jgi:hypothetical protein
VGVRCPGDSRRCCRGGCPRRSSQGEPLPDAVPVEHLTAPELVVGHIGRVAPQVANADRQEVGVVRIAGEGHRERVVEVRRRGADDREVAGRRRGRVRGVEDEDAPARSAARLEAEALVLMGGGGQAGTQAGAPAFGGVLDLHRGQAGVVVVHGFGHHAVRTEAGHRAPTRDDHVPAGSVLLAGSGPSARPPPRSRPAPSRRSGGPRPCRTRC